MNRIPVYVLAGGRSSRFGRDKARVTLGGKTLLELAALPWAVEGSEVTVVADAPDKYRDLGFRTVGDREMGLGPLGGLVTALADLPEAGWLLLTACDFIGARREWVDRLAGRREHGAGVVAFRAARWEPLFALYHTAVRDAAEAAVEGGQYALWRLLESVNAVPVPLPGDWDVARSVDTPAALAELQKRMCDAD